MKLAFTLATLPLLLPSALIGQVVAKKTYVDHPKVFQYETDSIHIPSVTADEPTIPFSPRLAVDYIEQGALAWTQTWGCVACHTNGSYMVIRPMLTPELGAPQTEIRNFFVDELKRYSDGEHKDEYTTRLIYMAAGLAIWDANVSHTLSPETARALGLMFAMQHPDGSWFVDDDNNPPLESSPYQLATVAARAVANAPGWLASIKGTPVEAHVALLKHYLHTEQKMQGDYDRVDLLWASSEWPSLLTHSEQAALIKMIESKQRIDGGWSIRTFAKPEEWGHGNRADKLRQELDFATPSSDAHMTGLAILALRKAGVPAHEQHIRAGVQWLLTNQRQSGRWYTRSLNRDGRQYITYSATAYALLALAMCNELPNIPPWKPRDLEVGTVVQK